MKISQQITIFLQKKIKNKELWPLIFIDPYIIIMEGRA